MSEKLKQQIMLAIENTIVLLTFAGLAVYFNKWWIVSLSAFFFTYTKNKEDK